MYSVSFIMNASEVGSHAVQPRASKVARSPPDGNEEASGSLVISSFPEKSNIILPVVFSVVTKESCFSAVIPVMGWNQWVKWVAPFSIAQSFIAEATVFASVISSDLPFSIVS